MAKSLGMIHTVNVVSPLNSEDQGQLRPVDLSLGLTSQLSRNIRQGQYFKLVGIDANIQALEDGTDTPEGGSVTGRLLYFAPTRGRCMAYRNAFRAVSSAMKDQGINRKADSMYDFRVAMRPNDSYEPAGIYTFPNQATLDGEEGLVMIDGSSQIYNIFQVHNSNVSPQQTVQPTPIPFGTYGNTTDFTLNDTALYRGTADFATLTPEEIPFTIAWDNDSEEYSLLFQWRPDPALYLSIMCGLIDVQFDNIEILGDTDVLNIQWAFHISGWKSIMGNPDKKKRSKRTTRGRRKKSKK